jgi:flavin reductase (DIM6/NTAB) family NADH-FMN oxidoreductase RutF
MTANSFTTVSLDPPLALVCVERDSRFHEAVLPAGVWAVSFLPEGAQGLATWFATRGRSLAGQFDGVRTTRGANGCLVLADALAGLELTTTQVVAAGDHDILIGRATAVHDPRGATPDASADGSPDAPRDASLDTPAQAPPGPTVYFASGFHGLA